MIGRYGYRLTIAALILLAPALSRTVMADQISNFDISGTAQNYSGGTLGSCASLAYCSFSGTMSVDTTTGTLLSASATFPGIPTLSTIAQSYSETPFWAFTLTGSNYAFNFSFAPSPTPGSLVGLTGDTSTGGGSDVVDTAQGSTSYYMYFIDSGSITSPSVPEPGSLALFAAGSLGLGFLAWRRKARVSPAA